MIRRRVLVSGEVQGVGFRYSCRREADGRGVAGWVRNLVDGRVEAVFEGDPDAVNALVNWSARGPRGAGVTGIDVVEEAPEGAAGFQIR